MPKYRIETTVTAPVEGSRLGQIGVSVRLMARYSSGEKIVGERLTRSDGTVTLEFTPHSEAIRADGSVLIRELLIDRNGVIIHEAQRARAVKAHKPQTILCRLDEEQIASHIELPLHFDRGGTGIDRSELEGDIELAIEGFAAPGSIEFTNFRTAALCPGPPIDLFDELTRDAIDVLDGDPLAIARFEDNLKLIRERRSTTRPTPATKPTEDVFVKSRVPGSTMLVDPGSVSPGLRRALDHRSPGRTPSVRTFVPRERAAVAMAAAVHVASSPGSALSNLDNIFDTLCEFEEIGVLRRIGLDGLTNPRSRAQFRGILGAQGGDWGPDDGPPIPERPTVPCLPFVDEHAECARDIARSITSFVPKYTISGIDAADACPGDTIEITGSGFKDEPGTVRFRTREGGSVDVDADVWTESRIVVEVPAKATCAIRLQIYERTDRICNLFVDVYRRPNILVDFQGGAANITRFFARYRSGTVCVVPGETFDLEWKTCAAETTRVLVRNASGSTVDSSSASEGTIAFTAPTSGEVTTWTATVTVTGRCAPTSSSKSLTIQIEPRPNLTIDGVEVTQAIQHYRSSEHLNNSAGPDNSLALVVGKMAWVRVYVRSGVDPSENQGALDGVTGSIRLSRIVGGSRQFVANLAAVNAPITAQSDWPTLRAERGAINNTLNFQIPANQMTGRLRLEIDVDAPNSCHGFRARDSYAEEVDVAQRNRLRLRAVPFAFQPPAGSGLSAAAAPTLTQFRTDAALAYAQWPTAAMRNQDATMTAVQITTNPLSDPRSCTGCCSANWGILLTALNQAATNDGPRANTVYYGYLPATIPVNVPGCGSGGRGAGRQGDTGTMTHEIGHGLGRPHSPCNVTGDNNYTVYQPYDSVITPPPNLSLQMASIGEFGLDIRNGNLFDPNSTSDLMSYCRPTWISKYVHSQVFNVAIMNPTAVPVGAAGPVQLAGATSSTFGADMEATPLIVIWGSTDQGTVDVSSVVRLTTIRQTGPETDLVAELIGDNDTVLSSATVVAFLNEGGCGCGNNPSGATSLQGEKASFDFRADLPDIAIGRELRIRRGTEVLWTRSRPKRRPRIQKVEARMRRDGKLAVSWSSTVADSATACAWITCTTPDGKDHQGLATDVTGRSTVIDIGALAGGKAVISVRLSDGFSCVTAKSKVINITERNAEVVILHPQEDEVLRADGVLCLQGLASDKGDHPVDECEWRVNGKLVGTTADVTIPMPEPGKHSLELSTGSARQRSHFTVAPSLCDLPPDDD